MYNIIHDLLSGYRATPDTLLVLLQNYSHEPHTTTPGREEEWSVVEVICHLRDTEDVSLQRTADAVSECLLGQIKCFTLSADPITKRSCGFHLRSRVLGTASRSIFRKRRILALVSVAHENADCMLRQVAFHGASSALGKYPNSVIAVLLQVVGRSAATHISGIDIEAHRAAQCLGIGHRLRPCIRPEVWIL